MTINTNIQGSLKLTTPLHCAAPGEFGIDDRGYVVSKKTGRPCTATVHQRILTDGLRDNIPYFPANDLRGRLRRKAANIVMTSLAAMGAKVPVELYAGLCAGAASAQPDMKGNTIEECLRAGRHIYMGLFGGGARLLRSGYSVQDAIPIVRSTVVAGLVPMGFGDYADKALPASDAEQDGESGSQRDGWKLTDVRHIVRVDDAARVLRPAELQSFVEDCEQSVTKHQLGALQNKGDRKEAAAAGTEVKKTDVGNMASVQSIIPGTELYVRIDMQDRMTSAQVGLMLSSLADLLNEQALGGWVRTGFGRFEARHFTLTIEGEEFSIFTRGPKGEYVIAEPLAPYVADMRQELSQLTVPDLMTFFVNRTGKEA